MQATRLAGSDGQPVVRVLVDPRPRSVITQVDFTVDGELQTLADQLDEDAARCAPSLRRGWPLRAGRAVPPGGLGLGQDRHAGPGARRRLPGRGRTKTVAQVDAEQHQVALTLAGSTAARSPPRRDPRRGAGAPDESTVRRLSTFAAGQPHNEKLLLDYQERIQKLGLFDSATVELDPTPRPRPRRRCACARELTSQQATVGVGISANTGPRVTLEHRHRRRPSA